MTGLPVVIVAGLHADARRAAVDALLRSDPGAVALHHDLSEGPARGTVARTVRTAAGGVVAGGEAPLVNDCACCALREDLVPELARLAADGACTLAVVELWDSVEPKSMAEVITEHADPQALRVAGVVTAVDPALALPYLGCGDDLAEHALAAATTDQRTVGDTWARQLEYATVLALAPGADSEEADDTDHALLAQLHPTAHRVEAADPRFAALATAGFDPGAAADRLHPASALLPQEADESGVTTLVWRRRRPFHPERLYAALEDLTCAAARSRGRFWLADRPDTLLAWDAAGGALCVEPAGPWLAALPDAAWEMVPPVRRAAAALDWDPVCGDRVQHLVFTSPGLDTEGLTAVLESCLLTDAEYAAGRGAWSAVRPSSFDTLLDPTTQGVTER
ncbi:GTP-binding protein [Streptomyces carpaticus]|uniref:GTPase, G3E family n=3 Tax=Streptomyces TaxID=1883 RepID=A0A1I6TG19_9ACTN|nr:MULTISPECIES: GTP-binding protein [Streptomyces]MCK1814760.1 GTP-binding protein [Streptomyces sp. XM4011]QKV69491.1 GTP-binding protein [Streptomyces harbinensis]UWM49883.1 GTP-binding protein [Streptomyces carpaticus]SFS88130.1 GTPase, G3E family [Streptomyces harbinensis]